MNYLRLLVVAAALSLPGAPIYATTAPAPVEASAPAETAEHFLASLKQQTGTVTLPGGIATLKLNDEFYYLDPKDTERLLTDGWGNPPGFNTLGMIIPKAVSPLSARGWGVIVSYKDDGHISDEDAAKIDYAELLKQMQEDDAQDNQERQKQGYAGLHLLGWAEPPHYDQQSHKMYWARELKADDADQNTLNYSIRVLGREGVLELNAVAAMADLPTIKQELPKVLAFTNFTDGNLYTDYNPSTDKLASYGLAALVAGGIAGKAGLFAKIGIFLLAAKKFLVIGVVALLAGARKFFNRNKG
ncbi:MULTISPECIES: DUF2167 domain-containing protein [Pseudomonas]|jgi:uncharacterized membrane-anchored protein|uniref:DUF2167 domain-containing protein n=1 Tax=Pseudomonas proteolytica TaxID=219574 RepID=A0AAP6YMU7_9PSED|nr:MULTISPECIES: DUF2167 domain-containing protein [Pseudomonas]KAA8703283.1 DUF2167 domain-containing protein [Pseudomonas proteolytica]MCF5058354.1 DUF2167 domain-containing protein [Pseudomonas proteolytica]MCF5102171.1 DUF2167 domain-containing protein [Pseudomonas proteolytica]MDF3161700.1 DUF2167 domain-containing protein [Pseudomonas proteolytica]NMZ04849.1 DUF2167 domain-containing protein [Pseudomonas proteolytica]